MKPGAKYYEWELRGIPLRLELGPRDLAANQGVLVRRDTREKRPVSLDTLGEDVERAARADPARHARRGARPARGEQRPRARSRTTGSARSWTAKAGSCTPAGAATRACEAEIKEETKATIRVPARRGVPLGRGADDLPQVRTAGHRRGVVGEGVLTSGFARVDGALACEGVPLDRDRRARSARRRTSTAPRRCATGTTRLDAALAPLPHRIHYTLKANSNAGHPAAAARARRRRGHRLGRRAAIARCAPASTASDIVFGGVGKTERELREALEAGVLLINVESEAELRADRPHRRRAAASSRRVGDCASIPKSRSTARTGTSRRARRARKFGIPFDEVLDVARVAAVAAARRAASGSTCTSARSSSALDPYVDGAERLIELLARASRARRSTRCATSTSAAGSASRTTTRSRPISSASPTRVVPARASRPGSRCSWSRAASSSATPGVLLTRVLYRKHSGGKEYLITDAGMTELIRPSHYDAYHRIEAVRADGQAMTADVVGPGVRERRLPRARPRDGRRRSRAICSRCTTSGAYGYVMASNYNTRPRGAEVLVDGDRFAVVTAARALRGSRAPRAAPTPTGGRPDARRTDGGHARSRAGDRRVRAA